MKKQDKLAKAKQEYIESSRIITIFNKINTALPKTKAELFNKKIAELYADFLVKRFNYYELKKANHDPILKNN